MSEYQSLQGGATSHKLFLKFATFTGNIKENVKCKVQISSKN